MLLNVFAIFCIFSAVSFYASSFLRVDNFITLLERDIIQDPEKTTRTLKTVALMFLILGMLLLKERTALNNTIHWILQNGGNPYLNPLEVTIQDESNTKDGFLTIVKAVALVCLWIWYTLLFPLLWYENENRVRPLANRAMIMIHSETYLVLGLFRWICLTMIWFCHNWKVALISLVIVELFRQLSFRLLLKRAVSRIVERPLGNGQYLVAQDNPEERARIKKMVLAWTRVTSREEELIVNKFSILSRIDSDISER